MTTASPHPSAKQRVALVIQYLGTRFHGWQRQPDFVSIQGEIEQAIAKVVGDPVTLHGAGRTDAGVHAAAQVAHFDDPLGHIPAARWGKVLNGLLPADIIIRSAAEVPFDWHARFSASWRRYRYSIYTDQWPNVFLTGLSWHYYRSPLREATIQAAMEPLLGKHHLAAFHRAGSSRPHSWVDVQGVDCYRRGPMVYLEIQANGFLYGMVRLLVGLLVEVGSGQRSLKDFTDLWMNQRRDLVKYAAPPQGLCLLRVGYDHFPFPPSLWFDTHPLFSFPG
ncbi:MAG: tRNA pseudouridine(38-40) synthase TruA [Synechocystis sp.]|nr:tRNA pseudouridine(38-40) synthase TruA [Synechocystis sp.]